MRRFLIFITICCTAMMAVAQSDGPLRIELPTAQDADDYHYCLLDTQGLSIFYEGNNLNADTTEWIVMFYDTNLQRQNAIAIPLSKASAYRNSHYQDNQLRLLFQEVVGKKETPRTFISSIDIHSLKNQRYELFGIPKFEYSTLKSINHHLIFSVFNEETYHIYFYNTDNQKLNEFIIPDAAIISEQFIEIDTFNHKVYLGLGVLFSNKASTYAIFETSYDGIFIDETALPITKGYIYHSVRMAVVDKDSSLLIGTYNISKSNKSGNYHTGVYTMTYHNAKISEPLFLNYSNLSQNSRQHTAAEKEQIVDLQLLVGDIIANDSCFSLITEVYYPEYSYSPSYYDNSSYYYGSTYNPAMTTFLGYRYVNAYVTAFDRYGKLLWNNYFPFSNIITKRLTRRVSLHYTPYGTAIFYPYNSTLTATLVNEYEVIEKVGSIPIECLYKKDVVEYSRDVNMQRWYDNKFVITGYQQINNNGKTSKGKRYVFFINKLEYR